MLLIFASAITLTLSFSTAGQEDTEAQRRATASGSTSNAGMVIARGPTLTGETKTVCRRERVMDSNIQQRVCRVVPVNSSQRARVNDDHVRELQRLPHNVETGFRRSPGGRSVN